ncbi:MAG: NAD(P)/FAD-dependent oxidoreductase [Bacteroidales bacterium]|nr:NAD(P)/FAD-dependent oxidoreductase [Bacteroidales bacterium]
MHYPVVIIGGGPAGMGAAIRLQKAGVDCCVVDRAVFPRPKLCGGLLTQKTKDLLSSLLERPEEQILQEVAADRHRRLRLFNRYEVASDVGIGIPFDLIHREVYDNYLVEHFKGIGGRIMEGACVDYLDSKRKELHLRSGDSIEYGALVAADGANSRVRNQLGLHYGKKLFCLEIFVRKEDFDFDGIGIYFDLPNIVYAWVFPKRDGYCIGIGSKEKHGTDYKSVFTDFLKGIGVRHLERYPLKGAFVPGGGFLKKPVYGDDLLLVGDAAGFADPLTGEGLYWSLYSGVQAAEALLAPSGPPAKEYLRRIRPVQKNIRSVSRIMLLFHKPFYQFWLRNVGRYPDYVRYFSDHQLSQVAEKGLISVLLKKVTRKYFSHLFRLKKH